MKTINLALFILLLSLLPYVQRHVTLTRAVTIPIPHVDVRLLPHGPSLEELLRERVERLADELLALRPPIPGSIEAVVAQLGLVNSEIIELRRVSAYNPVPRQTEGDPNVSSCGPNLENQIAVSRDLFFYNGVKHLCGREVVLVSTDRWTGAIVDVRTTVVYDTMNARYSRTADVFMNTTDESTAYAWGVKGGYLIIPQTN